MFFLSLKGHLKFCKYFGLISYLTASIYSSPPQPKSEWNPGESPQQIDIAAALELAYKHNPKLQAMALEYYRLDKIKEQEGKSSNPNFESKFENFLGSNEFSGYQNMEASASINQEIDLGGKIHKKQKIAEAHKNISDMEYQKEKRQLRYTVLGHYIRILALQERVKLLEQAYGVQQHILKESEKRFEAGMVSKSEVLRGQIELSLIHSQIDETKFELSKKNNELGSLWGSNTESFTLAKGNLIQNLPQFPENLAADSKYNNMDLQKLLAEEKLYETKMEFAKAQTIPNLEIEIGGKRDFGSESNALELSLSLPLPVWNQYSKSVDAVQLKIKQIQREKIATRLSIETHINSLYKAVSYHKESIHHLSEEIIPNAIVSDSTAQEAYMAGKVSQMDLLDNQRIILHVKKELIENYKMLYLVYSELELLSGTTIIEFKN